MIVTQVVTKGKSNELESITTVIRKGGRFRKNKGPVEKRRMMKI
jgi:hypothetical protein